MTDMVGVEESRWVPDLGRCRTSRFRPFRLDDVVKRSRRGL